MRESASSIDGVLEVGKRLPGVLGALQSRNSPLHSGLKLSQRQFVDVAWLALSSLPALVVSDVVDLLVVARVHRHPSVLADHLVGADHVHVAVLVVRRKSHELVNLVVGGCDAVRVDCVENVGDVLRRGRLVALLLSHRLRSTCS